MQQLIVPMSTDTLSVGERRRGWGTREQDILIILMGVFVSFMFLVWLLNLNENNLNVAKISERVVKILKEDFLIYKGMFALSKFRGRFLPYESTKEIWIVWWFDLDPIEIEIEIEPIFVGMVNSKVWTCESLN